MTVRSLSLLIFAIFSTVVLGLAAGAVWMVAMLYLNRPLPWLIVPIGAILGWTIRKTVGATHAMQIVLAVLGTALAATYVNILYAAVQISGNLGVGLVDTMRTAGFGMLWQIARMSMTLAGAGWAMLAMVLAAWVARQPTARNRAATAVPRAR